MEATWSLLMASLEKHVVLTRKWMYWLFWLQHCAPGLVDTHIFHGFGGVDVMDNNISKALHTRSEGLLSTGVTAFAHETLTSLSYEQLFTVTENIGARYKEATGAKIRGMWFEGPLFYRKYKEPKPSYMKDPSMEAPAWQKVANGLLNKIALVLSEGGRLVRTITGEGSDNALDTPMQLWRS